MKAFEPITFDFPACRSEVAAFETLLANNPSLGERREILPFFRKNRQAAALCGVISPSVSTTAVDRVAWEYDLFGEYACDLIVGDSRHRAYCLIEFEDATPDSIFKKAGKKAARDWSPRFEHGYSQIIDWFQKMAEMANNPEFEGRFDPGPVRFDAALVIGRDVSFAGVRELTRFRWRRDNVVVGSRHIQCVTFDELLSLMRARLTMIEQAAAAKGGQPP